MQSNTPIADVQFLPHSLRILLPPFFGLAILYLPTFWGLLHGLWTEDDQGHGPIILGVSIWLMYRKWPHLQGRPPDFWDPVVGWLASIVGLVVYAIGRSQAIIQFEVGSFLLVLLGVTLLISGRATLKQLWFPFFFMLFLIPLPGVFVQAVTIPLKTAVSFVAEHILYGVGYPIARSGVTLSVGPYQLLVADACAGMHTLFTLEALGLLYMNLVGHTALWRNLTIALMIFPISFCSNVIRVVVLILVTYHFGDAAGQGFLHGFAGMVLFLTALVLILGVDSLLSRTVWKRV